MKKKSPKISHSPLTIAAGRALRRAAKRAREVARMYGTPIHITRNGKIVAVKP